MPVLLNGQSTPSSSADGRAGPPSWTSLVRWMAELERSCCLHPVLAAPPFGIRTNLVLFHLDRSHRWNITI
ncbi:hypothetical protein F2Q69_00027850 [Brassica cretica]|uniref:Uncharacterized protein n=1 Tax=Brassica cretica TaxID=69181 RepID=A0A8S9RU37_BRACR|nr:hypothetical protein F2Q69_00027850 [Brassica cretica]